MKASQFKFLIIVLALTLLGLVGLQLYWLFSDYANKQEQLYINANEALNGAVMRMENAEAEQLLKFSNTDTVLNTSLMPTRTLVRFSLLLDRSLGILT